MKSLNVKRSLPFEVILVFATVACIAIYYIAFVQDAAENRYKELTNFANTHDHWIYTQYLDNLSNVESLTLANNNIGIAIIYNKLLNLPILCPCTDLEAIAAVINTITLLFCFLLYRSICNKLKLGSLGRISFFVNTSLIYFTQLINKDLFTILLFLLAIYYGLERKNWILIVLLPIFFLVRQQLAVFIILFFIFQTCKRPMTLVITAYIATSIFGAIIVNNIAFISQETLGDGFSGFVHKVNQEYLVGYLLFNPVRIIQFIYDVLLVYIPLNDDGQIDVAKILRIPPVTLLLLLLPNLLPTKINLKIWSNPQVRAITSTICAFIFTWLMNPTINARYLMLIVPALTLLALYTSKERSLVKII